MNRQEVDEKSYPLLAPVLGDERARDLINAIWDIEKVRNVRSLRSLPLEEREVLGIDSRLDLR